MTSITASHVARTFGPVTAVADASLTVAAGEIVGLIGANGAGKTTLIRILLGLIAPDRGQVELAGAAPNRRSRRRVGYVPQGMGLWTDLTLHEHLELSRAVHGHGREGIPDEQLARAADRPVGQLPLGLRRRAAFVVALAHHPEVLILDEPTSGVDPLARSRLWETITAAAAAGTAVLVSTHYLEEAARCDQLVLLDDGRVVAQGTVDEITADRTAVAVSTAHWQQAWNRLEQAGLDVLPAGRDLRLTNADPDQVGDILEGLDAQVATVSATLDEVFVAMTSR